MRLPKDILSQTYTKPKFFLCETNKERICQLITYNSSGVFKFNAISELSFDIPRIYNNIITGESKSNPFYNKIEALRLIEVENFGYFELQGPELTSDGIQESKSCKAYSFEYTLSQKYLENFYVNRGTVDSIEVLNAASDKDIVPITLYNPNNPKLSLLHLVLEKAYGWKVGHVDLSLQTLSRQFEVDRESIYDFLMNEVCEKFNCYIIFDTINNTINVYAESLTAKFIGDGRTKTYTISPPFDQINTVSVDGYKTTKWTYDRSTGALVLEDTPESGSHIEVVDGALTDWETDVFITFDNLSQEININYDADAIKTVLTVTYGDDYDIREVNLGLPYLTDISYYYTVDWMGQDLYDAYKRYLQKSNESQLEYTNNSQEILKINDCISYEENRLSLEYSLVESVHSGTVGTYYTKEENSDGSYYYKEVSLPGEYKVDVQYYSNATTNVNETKISNLYTVIKKYFYNYFNKKSQDEKGNKDELYDTYVTNIDNAIEELKGLSESFLFMETYTIQDLSNDLKNGSESEKEEPIKKFLKNAWVELGRTPLKKLYLEPYEEIRDTNISAGWSKADNINYGYYYPAIVFIDSINSAISERDRTIKKYEDERKVFQDANGVISDGLLMTNNFTEDQLIRLNAFLREDELHLDDIIETSQDNLSSSFKIKQDAMESGRIELQKLCQPQLQFSMTMANIYALSEFEPIIHQFQLGNVIKVGLRPDYIKQSRLLEVNINFDDFSDFSCEFGELTSLRTQSDIHADLLSQAISAGKSVATNSSYWTRGSDQATALDLKIQQGLLDATTQIKAIDGNQGVVIDKYGIKLQKKTSSGEIDPHQTWLVNNMILMSDDGFKTSRSALGEITIDGQSYYGLIAEMVLSGYIGGSKIVGGEIFSDNYESGKRGTYFNLNDGDFEVAGGNLSYSTDTNALTLKNVTIEWSSSNTPTVEIDDIMGLGEYIDQLEQLGGQLDNRSETWYQDTDPSDGWTTEEIKSLHAGDLWHYTGNTATINGTERIKNSEWIWKEVDGNYQWVSIEISDAVFDAIDGKAQIFTSTPIPPYYVGDLWVQGSDGDIMHCITPKEYGSDYSADDWKLSSKYTDDSALNSFISGDYKTTLDGLNESIKNSMARSWYQVEDPSNTWNTTENHIGDLWYCCDDSQKTYIYTESGWQETNVPQTVFDMIDGKRQIFVVQPTSTSVYNTGDLWILDSDTTVNKTLYKKDTILVANVAAGERVGYVESDWVPVTTHDGLMALDNSVQAIGALNDIGDDSKITPTEKQQIKLMAQNIASEYNDILKQCSKYSIDTKDFVSSYNNLKSLMDSITTNMSTTISPLPDGYPGRFTDYYAAKELIIDTIEDATKKYSDDLYSALEKELSDIADDLAQVDGRIQTYYQKDDPSDSTSWGDDSAHEGDVWVNTTNGETYQWESNGSGYVWVEIENEYLTNLAQSKAQIFTTCPTSYAKGDLIIPAQSFTFGNVTYYERAVYTAIESSNTFSNSHWTGLDYTNDDALNEFVNGDFASTIQGIRTDIDGKADTYYQSAQPHQEYKNVSDTKEYNLYVGDLWYDTDDGKTYIYQKTQNANGKYDYTWKFMNVPNELFDTIDGIASIYVTTPSSPVTGDLLIPASDSGIYKAGKVYRYNGSSWDEIAYTDDTVANEALEKAKQGLIDAATGINLANAAQTSANNAATAAESAETNAKNYADSKDSDLSKTLTTAYETYTNTEVGKLDSQVAKYFGLGGNTIVGNNYVISPYLGGGYLNITNTSNNASVIIDPNNLTKNGYIFQVHNGKEITVAVDKDGNTSFTGDITAKSLTLDNGVSISTNNISGLSSVATSGEYSDLSGRPTIPTSVTDLTGGANILYTDNVSISNTTTTGGVTKQTIKVGSKEYTSITSGDFVLTNVGIGTNSTDGTKSYTYISKDGLLTAKNALIYGTVYATNGKFSGELNATRGDIGGLDIGTTGVRYCGGKGNGIGVWKGGQHADDNDYIVFHAGLGYPDNDANLASAPFKIYQTGKLHIGNLKISNTGVIETGQVAGWEIEERCLKGTFEGDVVRLYPEKLELTKSNGTVKGVTWDTLLDRIYGTLNIQESEINYE